MTTSVTWDHLRKRGFYLLLFALMAHLISYVTPMRPSLNFNNVWGEVLLDEVLPNTLRWSRWRSGWFIFVALYVPFSVLLYTGIRFLRSHPEQRSIPSIRFLVIGLLLPNGIIPGFVGAELLGRSAPSKTDLIGYLVWNLSFWLFFAGFYCYKKSQATGTKDLGDHLIED